MNKKELEEQIAMQEQENIRMFSIFQHRLQIPEMQPLIQEWRKGSYTLKILLKELWEIQDAERAERIAEQKNEKETKTFVNGYGEATNKYITSQTYERAEKRRQKEVLVSMGNR